jgi:hypothetical protein
MPEAKPISLFPLTFEEALGALIKVDPEKVGLGKKSQSARPSGNGNASHHETRPLASFLP